MKLNLVICLALVISSLYMTNALYASDSKVVKLTEANFKSKVLNSNEVWLIEFYAPWCGHCKKLAPDFDKVANALDGIIRVGAVDMTTDQSAGAPYGVQGYPTIKLFGLDKNTPEAYSGDRSANDLISFSFQKAKQVAEQRLKGKTGTGGGHGGNQGGKKEAHTDKDVVILSDSDFDDLVMNSDDLWLVEFYAPWCGHCQRLEPEWNEAAAKLKGEVKVGKVDATQNQRVAQRFGINGYPTIKMFPSGKKSDHIAEDYSGSRDATSIASYALDKKAQFKPLLKVDQLVDQATFDKYCVEEKVLCLIAFLPHIYDATAAERQAQIDMLQEVQKNNRINPVAILWSQGGDQFDFEDALGLGSGYPSMLAVHVGKAKYNVMRGAFDRKNIDSWLNKLLSGREGLSTLRHTPKIKGVTRWDGKDQKPQYEADPDL